MAHPELLAIYDQDGSEIISAHRPRRNKVGQRGRPDSKLSKATKPTGRRVQLIEEIEASSEIHNFQVEFDATVGYVNCHQKLKEGISYFTDRHNSATDHNAKNSIWKFLKVLERAQKKLEEDLKQQVVSVQNALQQLSVMQQKLGLALDEVKTAAPGVASESEEKKKKKKKKKKPPVSVVPEVDLSEQKLDPASTSKILSLLGASDVALLEVPVAPKGEALPVVAKDPLNEISDVATNPEQAKILVGELSGDIGKLKTVPPGMWTVKPVTNNKQDQQHAVTVRLQSGR